MSFEVLPVERAYMFWQSEEGKYFLFCVAEQYLLFSSELQSSSVGKRFFAGLDVYRLGSDGWYVVY